jgi:hypothetical protein
VIVELVVLDATLSFRGSIEILTIFFNGGLILFLFRSSGSKNENEDEDESFLQHCTFYFPLSG